MRAQPGGPLLELAWSVLWPAVLAGIVATLVTVAIARFGGVIGGIIGTLPTTIVPAARSPRRCIRSVIIMVTKPMMPVGIK